MSLKLVAGLAISCGVSTVSAAPAGAVGAADPLATDPREGPAPIAMTAPGAAGRLRSIVVEVSAGAPFDADELTAAMRVRLPADGAPVQLRVSTTRDGVRIEARGNMREVELRGLTGTAAARLVALAANDLLLDDLAATPAPPLEPPAMVRAAVPGRGSTSFGVLGAAAAWQHVLGGLGVDFAIPRGRWLLAIDASGGILVDGPLELSAAVVRVGGGARIGWLELRAGATLAPVIVGNGDGDRTLLAGVGASARVRVPIASGVRAVLAGGADLFATRTTYVVDGMPVLATPRGAPWLAAGVEVTP